MGQDWRSTHCGRMDHGGCSLRVKVEGGRVTRVKGDPEGRLNKGYVCGKGRALAELQGSEYRLRQPLLRQGPRGSGDWREIDWSEALDRVAHGLQQTRQDFGARSVAFCQGMPKGLEHFALIRLANSFGTPNVVAVQDVCHAPRELTGRRMCGFYPVPDLDGPGELILLWGSNPTVTNEEGEIHTRLMRRLREGAKLVVVDPRRTQLAARADVWLPVRPGADLPLALAFLYVIFEEDLQDLNFLQNWCRGWRQLEDAVGSFSPERMSLATGVEPQLIREAARAYARARPATLAWGNAVEQTEHCSQTIQALLSLMAVCGNLNTAGGNTKVSEPEVLSPGRFVRADLLPRKREEILNFAHAADSRLMTVPPSFFRQAVVEEEPYPVRAAYMQCTNPLLTWADSDWTHRALSRLDFLAVSELVMTPTAAMADVVLPAASHLEFDDMGHYGLGRGMVLARPGAVEPPSVCRPDLEIINDLGHRLTDPELWFERGRDMLQEVLAPSGLDWAAFSSRGVLAGQRLCEDHLDKGFSTTSGLVELEPPSGWHKGQAPEAPCAKPGEGNSAWPLLLTSSKSPYFLHSSYRWIGSLREKEAEPRMRIHPETARDLGLKQGEWAVLETEKGGITQRVETSQDVRRDTVCAAYGWWYPEGSQARWREADLNRIIPARFLDARFGTPRLRGVPCRVYPASKSRLQKLVLQACL